MSSATAATCQHGPYHQCACYNHNTALPNYRRDVANPRTLQGYYAPNGGCPCPAGCNNNISAARRNSTNANVNNNSSEKPQETLWAADGPHTVHLAAPAGPFPNSRNYGGTVAQRGPASTLNKNSSNSTTQLSASRPAKAQVKAEERAQDRKNFLKAVLRDEILSRIDAEGRRAELEGDTGLMGTNHVDDYESSQRSTGKGHPRSPASRMASRGPNEVPTVGEQYGEIMDELEFVAGQPVGSKYNIIRLHYLVDEERRLNELRRQARLQESAMASTIKQKK